MAKGNPASQRMINMMYLVLTALLALNVSKEVLKSFFQINVGIERTTDNIEDTIPSISGIGISPEGNNDGSEEEERAGVKGIAEEAFSRGRERIDEAKKKFDQYDKEETEDDPFEKLISVLIKDGVIESFK